MTSSAAHEPVPSITLGLAGDVMLGRLVADTIQERGPSFPWGDLAPALWGVDAFLINLECALTNRVVKWHDGHYKPFHFRADPGAVETLRLGRVDCASLANNHIGDFGLDGLLDTTAALDAARISHAGAGRDIGAARAPAILHVRGLRVAILAIADYPETWAATDTAPGLNFAEISIDDEDFTPIAEAIAGARDAADLVILSAHWGPNMRERPPEDFRHFAHRVLDAGVHVFWGHSAHIVQGIEFRDDCVILYDTGDFVDDYAVDPSLRNDLGALFLIRARRGVVDGVELIPTRIQHMRVNRATGEDRDWFLRRLEELCREMGSTLVTEPNGVVHVVRATHVIPYGVGAP